MCAELGARRRLPSVYRQLLPVLPVLPVAPARLLLRRLLLLCECEEWCHGTLSGGGATASWLAERNLPYKRARQRELPPPPHHE